ncbi:MAG: aminotransferase class I/II-fold pyridoxal phosphate-dependent enzyme [Firmicutes bacterium]|nr:aminotransferase class I/II-fold pyridoxal phosphate-dependent enzyme [Bacillota bacterium]
MSRKNLHGGDLDEIARIYGIEKSKIMNFSGNVNPLGLPPSVKKAIAENVDIATGYPDVSYTALRGAISDYTGAKAEHIIVGNGSTELITGFIKAVMPKKSVIISPAYSEYLRILEQINCEVTLFPLDEKSGFVPDTALLPIDDSTDMLIFCSPNNPTGTYFTADETKELAERCKKHGCFIMTDETYVEFADPSKHISAVELADKYDNIAVVRGTSKFFACPGLRLGYGITGNAEILEKINTEKDLWSVNVYAELAGKVMFKDRRFINATIELINTERARFYAELGKIPALKLYPTQSNFFLVKILDGRITSRDVFLELIQKNILIRDAENFPFLDGSFFRFCILSHEENTLLIEALKEIFAGRG